MIGNQQSRSSSCAFSNSDQNLHCLCLYSIIPLVSVARLLSHFSLCLCLLDTQNHVSLFMRKPAFCICENKDADQLHSNCAADQRLCFHYMDSTIPLLSKSEISSLQPLSVGLQPGLCQTWSETPKTGFLTTRLRFSDRPGRKPRRPVFSQRGSCFLMMWLKSSKVKLCCN